jgi:AcrR family transcriptional regulator
MNEKAGRRGRPRSFDAEEVLTRARDVFWAGGFSGSSLDDLGAAMAMNRPSLYNAFGDKAELYLATLARYRAESLALMRRMLEPARPLAEGLRQVYAKAIASYLAGETGARGCFLIGTAATEAVANAAVRRMLHDSLADFEQAFEARFRRARKEGEIARDADPVLLARLASAVLHSLAVRARAGETRAVLDSLAEGGVRMICGPARKEGQAKRREGPAKKQRRAASAQRRSRPSSG